jgi:glycosyltransferase involved in cell wall biosynthesis
MDKDIKNPFVSVLMPVFNGEAFLEEAILGILNQSYKNFEFIILNDGSTDRTAAIINSFKDSRIRPINNTENKGLVEIMNQGLHLANGEYIIRADSDDISLPKRIEKQVNFLQNNSSVGVVCCWLKTLDNKNYIKKSYSEHDLIAANLLFNTSIPQPGSCFRTSLIRECNIQYDSQFKDGAEDYELWSRLKEITRLACLPEVLVLYRIHKASVSHIKRGEIKKNADQIRLNELKKIDIYPTPEELELHSSLSFKSLSRTYSLETFLEKEKNWLQKIKQANLKYLVYSDDALDTVIQNRWFEICYVNSSLLSLKLAFIPTFSPTIKKVGLKKILKLVIKSFLNL